VTVADAAQVGSAVFTAGTAFYAFRSVRLGERQWRTAKEPDIHLQVLLAQGAGTTDLALVNVGGWARSALYAMSVGDQRASSYIGDSLIAPSERIYIHTELPQSEDTKVLLLYRGMDETSYRVVRGRPRETLSEDRDRPETSLGREWSDVYPDDDWMRKEAVPQRVKFPSRDAHF
jgi:hypothetical protein